MTSEKLMYSLADRESEEMVFRIGSILLLFLAVLQCLAVIDEPNTVEAWLAVGTYVVFGVVLISKRTIFFWLIFLFYFGQSTAVVSCAHLEGGSYITEQQLFSYVTGGTLRLVMYNLVFFLSALLCYSALLRQKRPVVVFSVSTPKWKLWSVFGGTIVFLLILLGSLDLFGSALLAGIDRIAYWRNHPVPIIRTISGQVLPVSFMLGLVFAHSKKYFALLLFLALCVYLALQSEKFTGLFTASFLFFLPVIVVGVIRRTLRISLARIALWTGLAGIVLLSLIYYHYSVIHAGRGVSALEAISNRALGLQGHVWWRIDAEVMKRSYFVDSEQFGKELSSLFAWSQGNDEVGMRFLIRQVAPVRIANSYIGRGVNFTMGYPAIGLHLFSYLGLLVLQIVIGAIVATSLVYLCLKIVRFQLVRSFVAMKAFLLVYAACIMGNFYQLFSLKMVLYICVAAVVEFLALVYIQKTEHGSWCRGLKATLLWWREQPAISVRTG